MGINISSHFDVEQYHQDWEWAKEVSRLRALNASVASENMSLRAENEALRSRRLSDPLLQATLGPLLTRAESAEAKVAALTKERDEWRSAFNSQTVVGARNQLDSAYRANAALTAKLAQMREVVEAAKNTHYCLACEKGKPCEFGRALSRLTDAPIVVPLPVCQGSTPDALGGAANGEGSSAPEGKPCAVDNDGRCWTHENNSCPPSPGRKRK